MTTVYVEPTAGKLTLGTEFFSTLKPGTTVVLKNGTYDSVSLSIPESVKGTQDLPITIRPESADGVTFTGATRIQISGDYVNLQGFTFKQTGADSIRVLGDHVQIEDNHFIGAGSPTNTQATIIWVNPTAQHTQIIGNEFEGSLSMGIKVRAGEFTSPDQPLNTVIAHNYFHDIQRLSGNGQEPIQIAGPGGQWFEGQDLLLNTLITHNVFLRAGGDVEAVSMKVGGNHVVENLFMDMDAAPTVRNGGYNEISGNILINTRAIRVMGDHSEIKDNIIINPTQAGIILANGTTDYEVAANNLIQGNTIYSMIATSGIRIVNQTSGNSTFAHDNVIANNSIQILPGAKLYDFTTAGTTREAYFNQNVIDNKTVLDANSLQWLEKILSKVSDPMAILKEYLLPPTAEKIVYQTNYQGNALGNVVKGDEQNNAFYGYEGIDRFSGLAGKDLLDGGAGNDRLDAGEGSDLLIGGLGADILTGGAGADVFRFNQTGDSNRSGGRDRITDFTKGEDKIDLTGLGFHGVVEGYVNTVNQLYAVYNAELNRTYVGGKDQFQLHLDGKIELTDADFVWG